ncbi:hypothetical protein EGW08_014273 [Elysia chlorotica]|uniref:Uncharacterized protein n=1 Tax=Elysia chlorotica TaxID=188477 RepID=A0A433T934_ELYCH|nr:hypothetical protein EGW08_014273 [Elysia chlorotica]
MHCTVPSGPASESDTVITATTVPSGAASETSAQGSPLFRKVTEMTGGVFAAPVTVTSTSTWLANGWTPPSTASTRRVCLPTGSGPRVVTAPVCSSTWKFWKILASAWFALSLYCTCPFTPRSGSLANMFF